MQSTLNHPSTSRDEIESPLQAKYGITLSQRSAPSSSLPAPSASTSTHSTRDEVERLLSAKYGLGFVRKAAVGARDEMAAMVQARYGVALKQ